MSLEDLERAGVLRPRREWGKHNLRTTVNKPLLAIIGVVALGSTASMYWGDGAVATWIGAGLFLMALAGFTVLSIRAINKQQAMSEPEKRPPTSRSR